MNNTKHDSEEGRKQKSRLKEITEVLHRNKITRGVSPEKLRVIIEELGATYIKLGQINPCTLIFFQSDIATSSCACTPKFRPCLLNRWKK